MTKWNPYFKFADNINKTIDVRLANLSPYGITVYQIHNSHSFSGITEQMSAMASLVKTGKIKYVGVSNFNASQLRIAYRELNNYGIKLVSNQCRYNLLKRDVESNGILDICKELGVTFICYSPLEKGLLSGKFHSDPDLINKLPLLRRIKFSILVKKTMPLIEIMQKMAVKNNCSVSNIAMNWILQKCNGVVLTGVSKVDQLLENINGINIKLERNQIEYLDSITEDLKLIYV
jgi:aryl-alcohol dehydrogenase-like predicted oxidoreductase